MGKSRLVIGLKYFSPVSSTVIHIKDGSSLIITGNVSIMKGCLISINKGGKLSIGANTFVNEGTKILVYKEVNIGSDCAISFEVIITDSDIHRLENSTPEAAVTICNNVWVGFRASIIKGSYIGDGSVVGCNSLVNNSFENNSVIAGVPGTVIKSNISWSL